MGSRTVPACQGFGAWVVAHLMYDPYNYLVESYIHMVESYIHSHGKTGFGWEIRVRHTSIAAIRPPPFVPRVIAIRGAYRASIPSPYLSIRIAVY